MFIYFLTLVPGVQREPVLAAVSFGYVVLVMLSASNIVVAYVILRKSNIPPLEIE
ncbi:MAG: hypothetical protein HQK83_08140 [Fibrobacteria bacterium]|nr:hypothetical protein [Fibrobacteria bacterium]